VDAAGFRLAEIGEGGAAAFGEELRRARVLHLARSKSKCNI
jgi:hypothetical protein